MSEDIELERLEPSDLASVPIVVQALDNQWVPRSLWQRILQKGQLTDSLEKQRKKLVRAEYTRALVNGKQVVLNRAYIYNSHAMFQDYLQKGQRREAFKALLEEGIIVPYLYREKKLAEPPPFGLAPRGFPAWQRLSQEVRMRCVRLSWDDELNTRYTHDLLARRFHNFALTAATGDLDTYIQDLGSDPDAKSGLRNRLLDMARMCLEFMGQGRLVTRNDLYQAFVTAGDNPAERRYDVTRPFAGEIKELLDLAYNSYLADALGGSLLTPLDSLSRTALQEWQQAGRQPEITSDELVNLLQQSTFGLVQGGLYLKSMDVLSLPDVREVRRTDEWIAYIESLEALRGTPFQFTDGSVVRVYQNYLKLAEKMTDLVIQQSGRPRTELTARWAPVIELVIDVAGAVLSVTWTSEGQRYQFSGEVALSVAAQAAPVAVRLVIRDMARKRAQAHLATSIDFMKYRMRDARQQWADIQRRVRELPGFREMRYS